MHARKPFIFPNLPTGKHLTKSIYHAQLCTRVFIALIKSILFLWRKRWDYVYGLDSSAVLSASYECDLEVSLICSLVIDRRSGQVLYSCYVYLSGGGSNGALFLYYSRCSTEFIRKSRSNYVSYMLLISFQLACMSCFKRLMKHVVGEFNL